MTENSKFPRYTNNLYIAIRHGATKATEKDFFAGDIDIPLSPKGIIEAENIQTSLFPDIIISSPLSRALNTATIFKMRNNLETPIEVRPELREKSGGETEGMLQSEVKTSYPEIWNSWNLEEPLELLLNSKYPKAESYQEVMDRARNLLLDLEDKYQNKLIFLFTHAGTIRVLKLLMGVNAQEVFVTSPEIPTARPIILNQD